MSGSTDRTRLRALVLGGAAVILLLLGSLLSGLGRGDEKAPAARSSEVSTTPSAPGAVGAGPTSERAGMPVGFSRGRSGAIAAGTAYATASQRWLYFTDGQISDALAEIATPDSQARLTHDVVSEVGTARDRLRSSSGPVWWLVRALAWKVESFDQREARVSVWTVTVLSAAKVAAPQSEWMTVTVDLRWVHGDWRVDDVRDIPGPTPMMGPKDRAWDAEPFDDALDGYTRLDGEPVS
jgi:hypothetical protein